MNELIDMVIGQLGVNDGQAKGGLGIIFKLAQEKLGGDFGQITDVIGDVQGLIDSAPEAGGLGSLVGGLGGMLGGKADQLGDIAELASGFKGLDLDASMVGKFGEVVMDFIKSKGGDSLIPLLQGLLKG